MKQVMLLQYAAIFLLPNPQNKYMPAYCVRFECISIAIRFILIHIKVGGLRIRKRFFFYVQCTSNLGVLLLFPVYDTARSYMSMYVYL